MLEGWGKAPRISKTKLTCRHLKATPAPSGIELLNKESFSKKVVANLECQKCSLVGQIGVQHSQNSQNSQNMWYMWWIMLLIGWWRARFQCTYGLRRGSLASWGTRFHGIGIWEFFIIKYRNPAYQHFDFCKQKLAAPALQIPLVMYNKGSLIYKW